MYKSTYEAEIRDMGLIAAMCAVDFESGMNMEFVYRIECEMAAKYGKHPTQVEKDIESEMKKIMGI